MSDMLARLGLDRREYSDGLKTAEREARVFGRNFDKAVEGVNFGSKMLKMGLGVNMVTRVFGAATRSVDEYAKTNAGAAEVMGRMEETFKGFQAAIGATLLPAFEALVGVLDSWTEGLGTAARAEAESIRRSEELAAAHRKRRAEWAADEKFLRELRRAEEDRASSAVEAAGMDGRGSAVERARLGFSRQIEDIADDPNLSEQQRSFRRQALERARDSAGWHAGYVYDLQRSAERDASQRALSGDAAQREVAILRASGRDIEAMVRQAQIAANAATYQIQNLPGLDDSERMRAIGSATADAMRLLSAQLGSEEERALAELAGLGRGRGGHSRSLYAGVGGALGQAAVFGAGAYAAPGADAMLRAQERLEQIQKKQTEVLESIRENTARGTIAIVG